MFIPKEVYRTLACLQVSSASAQKKKRCVITTEVLCNNNRRKDLLTELFLSAVTLPLLVFQILLSNLLACLIWYCGLGWVIHYENKMVEACWPGVC